MKYDFDKVIDRRQTGCAKWDMVESIFGDKDVLPMWVADMDFPVAAPITEAIRRRAEHEIYGYTVPGASVIESVVERVWQKYGWKIQPEWVVFTPGVVPALHVAVRAFTHPGDHVIAQGPVYYPFWAAIRDNGCTPADNELRLVNGRYEMDFADLRNRFRPREAMMPSPSRVAMMILCSPHNPVGRVWREEELAQVGDIAREKDIIVVSDEIHCELLFRGSKHIPFASLSPEIEQISITCMAPSKTFNIPGLQASSIIIPNQKLRNAFNAARAGILPQPNTFGLVALEAAYRYGDEWLEQLLDYLQGNLEFLIAYVSRNIPRLKVIKPEGTYLVWLDCRELGMGPMELRKFMRQRAKVGLDDGYLFSPGGAGFQRMNIACPRATLREALQRIERAVSDLG
ncbi:MAG: pyridoxal phosphate-dependent aminotransferase [Dehalococcoidales bacterium]|nr:pyridoxal phosphate-dependent aminotransferase [Dehalococcoidales bacterium]